MTEVRRTGSPLNGMSCDRVGGNQRKRPISRHKKATEELGGGGTHL